MPVPSFAPEPPSEGISEGNATDVSRHLDGQPLHCAMFPFCFLSLADKVLVDVDINIKPRDSWSLFCAFLPQKAKRRKGFYFQHREQSAR
jgi:hypothetical protein